MHKEEVDKIRDLLSHSDPKYEHQGSMLLESLETMDFEQLSKGCSLRNWEFGKSSKRWMPEFNDWPNITQSTQATSAMIDVLFRNPNIPVADIHHLSLHGFKNITNIDFLARLPNLKSVSCTFCSRLTDLTGLSGLKYLEQIDMTGSPIRNLGVLKTVPRLLFLSMGFSELSDDDLHHLKGLPKLVELEIKNLKHLRSLQFVSEMPRLIKVNISNCENLKDVNGMKQLPKLREIRLQSCGALQNVDALSDCLALKEVDLSVTGIWEPDWQQYMRGKHSLVSIEGLMALENLQKVDVSNQTLIPQSQIQQLADKKVKTIVKGCTV